MPRLNVYLPDDVYELASRWRDNSNLSEICARAIKDEFEAAEGHRRAPALLSALRPPSRLELEMAKAFRLAEVITESSTQKVENTREAIGRAAANYLDRSVADGVMIALAGGRQMWCMVQHLSPRRIQATISALGIHQADPKLLHVHPNTIATLLWLLYSPRSQAHLIGSPAVPNLWLEKLPSKSHPSYFVISSCSRFDEKSPFADLVGPELTQYLKQKNAFGDFAYSFFGRHGAEIEIPPTGSQFRLPSAVLRELSKRPDARTVLVAAGKDKIETIRVVINAGLCNTLITDETTAERLLE